MNTVPAFFHESLFHIGLWKVIFCTLLHFDMSVFGICDVYLFRFTTWRTENMSQHKPQSAVSSPRTYFKHHFLWRVDSIIVFFLLLWCLLCLLSCCCVLMCLVLKTLHMFVYISYIYRYAYMCSWLQSFSSIHNSAMFKIPATWWL